MSELTREDAEILVAALKRRGLKIVRANGPDVMDLARIGEVLADEFTVHPAVAAAEVGPPDLPDDHPVSWFRQHVYSSSHREDGDRLVELLDRLGFEIVRKETP